MHLEPLIVTPTPLLLGELLIGAAYLIVGYVIFRRFELLVKRKGTLEAA